ncbi:hypothetical protein ES703_16903 [subsurface metagenome]
MSIIILNNLKSIQIILLFKDSTGAGDNFDAGFIYGFMNNLDIRESLRIANICGAKSVEYVGGVGNIKKFREIKELIELKNKEGLS